MLIMYEWRELECSDHTGSSTYICETPSQSGGTVGKKDDVPI